MCHLEASRDFLEDRLKLPWSFICERLETRAYESTEGVRQALGIAEDYIFPESMDGQPLAAVDGSVLPYGFRFRFPDELDTRSAKKEHLIGNQRAGCIWGFLLLDEFKDVIVEAGGRVNFTPPPPGVAVTELNGYFGALRASSLTAEAVGFIKLGRFLVRNDHLPAIRRLKELTAADGLIIILDNLAAPETARGAWHLKAEPALELAIAQVLFLLKALGWKVRSLW